MYAGPGQFRIICITEIVPEEKKIWSLGHCIENGILGMLAQVMQNFEFKTSNKSVMAKNGEMHDMQNIS